jgi:putative nucleotidyltransferase with HDIG domain
VRDLGARAEGVPPGRWRRLSDPLGELGTLTGEAWLVGGALRDRLRGVDSGDYDVAVAGEPRKLARALSRRAGGHAFELSGAFGAWRVVAHSGDWQVDLMPLAGATIEADLAQRDFTINAIAEPLRGGDPIDPFGGVSDLRARRLRMVAPDAFTRDPLRVMRLARIASELDLAVEAQTVSAARTASGELARTAPERVFSELRRIISVDAALGGLELMDRVGAMAAVLPELARLRGVEQSRYHHLDVHDHTRAVLAETIALERDPRATLGDHGDAVARFLAEPFTQELTRGQALRFGALFHDVAKPQTRGVTDTGRVTFMGHDTAGAELASEALGRLRASRRLREYVAALTRHHLRLGFLVHEMPLSRRAIYRYMTVCAPVQIDVTLLSVADRLATRGSGASEAIAKHLALARQLLGEALAWSSDPPRPPLRGGELDAAIGPVAGPEMGRLLAELQEASFAGEISGHAEAIALARKLLGR